MNTIIKLIIVFVFVFVLLTMNLSQLQQTDHLKFKAYIFVGIFVFMFAVGFLISFQKKDIINVGNIIHHSFVSSLLAIIAYSIHIDLKLMGTDSLFASDNEVMNNLIISGMISLFIGVGYLFDKLYSNANPGINDCLNILYKANNNYDQN